MRKQVKNPLLLSRHPWKTSRPAGRSNACGGSYQEKRRGYLSWGAPALGRRTGDCVSRYCEVDTRFAHGTKELKS
jgi:hypothetical protein